MAAPNNSENHSEVPEFMVHIDEAYDRYIRLRDDAVWGGGTASGMIALGAVLELVPSHDHMMVPQMAYTTGATALALSITAYVWNEISIRRKHF